jgi:transcriptional regulator with XRE-family HTH domain
MRRTNLSEKLLLEEVTESAERAKKASKGLSIGSYIKMIRLQLGMSQVILAKRASVPQSTISRIEKGDNDVNLSTLNKILEPLLCDFVVVPMLREPIDKIRRKQARKQAEKHIRYLKGTMSLEEQKPDSRFLEELLKQEEERLLSTSSSDLWQE